VRHLSVPFRIALLCALAIASVTSRAPAAEPPAWGIPPVPTQPNVSDEYVDVATYWIAVGAPHRVCWSNGNSLAGGAEDKNLVLEHRRYRVEGGPTEVRAALPYASWQQGAPRNYCAIVGPLPKAGHWVFEARFCWPGAACSDWVTTIVPAGTGTGAGAVGDKPRGWWIYAYLAAPGGIEI
jgi:hypothetical protein